MHFLMGRIHDLTGDTKPLSKSRQSGSVKASVNRKDTPKGKQSSPAGKKRPLTGKRPESISRESTKDKRVPPAPAYTNPSQDHDDW